MRRAALLGCWLLAGGCYAYRPVTVVPAPESRVRVVFDRSIDVTTVPAVSDSARTTYPAVLEASGTIVAATGDTVALRLGELRTTVGMVSGVSGRVALLPAERIARIDERRFQAGTTFLGGLGLSLLAVGVFVVVITVALVRGI